MLSNISFQIPIGIVFLLLSFWRIVENNNDNKEVNKKSKSFYMFVLIIGIIISIILGILFYEYNPLNSLENQKGLNYLSSYTYDSFIVFNRNIKYQDNTCLSTFISVFPIGLFIGLWYIFKEEKKHLFFIGLMTITSILELLLITSNITIPFIPNYIFVLGFNLLQIFMILYIFARVEERLFNLTKSAYIALFGLVLIMFLPVPSNLTNTFKDLSYILFVLEAYMILNYTDKRFWRLASWIFTIICAFDFISGIIVNFM